MTPCPMSAAPCSQEGFSLFSVTLLPNWPLIQRAPRLESQARFPWPWRELDSCFSSGHIRTITYPTVLWLSLWQTPCDTQRCFWALVTPQTFPSPKPPLKEHTEHWADRLLSALGHVCIIAFMKCVFILCHYAHLIFCIVDRSPRSLIIISLIRYT